MHKSGDEDRVLCTGTLVRVQYDVHIRCAAKDKKRWLTNYDIPVQYEYRKAVLSESHGNWAPTVSADSSTIDLRPGNRQHYSLVRTWYRFAVPAVLLLHGISTRSALYTCHMIWPYDPPLVPTFYVRTTRRRVTVRHSPRSGVAYSLETLTTTCIRSLTGILVHSRRPTWLFPGLLHPRPSQVFDRSRLVSNLAHTT